MGNYFGVVAPTGYSQNGVGDGPESSRNKRSGAGKEKAAKRAMTETAGTTIGGETGTTVGTTDVAGTTTDASGVPGTTAALSTTGGVPPATTPLGGTKAATSTEDIFDFGLEDDGEEWTDCEGPERITQSRLTTQERNKFRGHLDLIFSSDTILGTRINFDPDDVVEVMKMVQPYLESEPVLIEDVPFGVTIVGDLYGQLYDLNRVFHGHFEDGKPGWECQKFVFMGNYIDRGRQSLEVLMALFCIKMLYPADIFLLRGNHEFAATNFKDGFLEELGERYSNDIAEILYLRINGTFCYLSVAAIVGDSYLCVHTGISPSRFTRRHMRAISKPITFSTDDTLIHDMVWSDPAKGLPGTTFNIRRGTSFHFGHDALIKAITSMGVKAIFRGHTRVQEGYENFWDLLYTFFTATDHGFKGNKGSVAVIDANGKLTVNILEINPRRSKLQRDLAEYARTGILNAADPKTKLDTRTKVDAKKAAKAK